MKKINFILIVILLSNSNCKDSNSRSIISSSSLKVKEEIKLQLKDFLSYQHSFARGVFLTDTSIILTNNKDLANDYFFYEFSIASKKQIGKYVKFGRKENEVLSPLSYGLSKDGSLFVT
ncbi:MAG: TolB-like 6-bladed beta-propeller domain-containing protein, partial [Chitinophagaceae bacterium]|nr:TolB-like 6-bladed beta-propeller domain-containing protein [Chitinophagaceae bacterium]